MHFSRQVGEAVRIGFRGLSSTTKCGYNTSAINRLVMDEKKGDQADGSLTDKRKDDDMPEGSQKQKKIRLWQYSLQKSVLKDYDLCIFSFSVLYA
jgi:hypothetical protein